MNQKKDAENYYHDGRSATRTKQFKRAIVNFTRAIKLDRNKWTAFFEIGLAYAKQEEYNKACSLYKKAAIIDPQKNVIYFNFGCALQSLGKVDKSIKMYRQALCLNPEDGEAHYNLAIMLTTKGEFEEAQEHYMKVLELDLSLDFMVYNCLGYLYFLKGDFIKASVEFQRSISCKEKYTRAYCNLSLVLFCEGKYEEAEKKFEEGMEILEEDERKKETIKEIIESYTSEKVRLEMKLSGNGEIMDEEKMALLKILVDGLMNMINLLKKEQTAINENRFRFRFSFSKVPKFYDEDLYI